MTGDRQMSGERWALAATILGSLMAFVDGTVVNVALPVLQSDLHATINDAQWVVNAYLLVLSALILAGGSLGDRIGLVRTFGAGTAIFACASLWCAVAPNVAQLILARAVQGIGGALLVPGSLAIITEVFPADKRGKAIGVWSALTSLAIIAGPVLGGFLVQIISWRAVFVINAPIALVVLWILARHMPAIPPEGHGAIDWLGALLAIVALGAITWSLIEMPVHPGLRLAAAAFVGVCCMLAFVFVESRAKQPLVPPALFKSRAFVGANVLTLLLYGALSVAMFILPFEWIHIRHYAPAEAGAAFLPIVATMSILSPLAGSIADRFGPRPLLIAGPVIVGVGFSLLVLLEREPTYWSAFAPGLFTAGLGMGLTVAPLTATVMSSIGDGGHAGAASGVNNAVARAAGLLAIAVFGAATVFVFSAQLDRQLAEHGVPSAVRQEMTRQRLYLANATPPSNADALNRAIVERSIRSAFQKAFAMDMMGAAALAIISAGGATLIRPQRGRRS